MWLITGLSEGMLILSILVKVGGGAEVKEGHSFLEIPLVAHLLLGLGVPTEEAIKVLKIQL